MGRHFARIANRHMIPCCLVRGVIKPQSFTSLAMCL